MPRFSIAVGDERYHVDARSWYDAKEFARGRWGDGCKVEASANVGSAAFEAPTTATATERELEHSEACRAEGYREGLEKAIDLAATAAVGKHSIIDLISVLKDRFNAGRPPSW